MVSPAETMDMSQLSVNLEQLIETAVERAVSKAMANHHVCDAAIQLALLRSQGSTIDHEEGSLSNAQCKQDTGVDKRVPPEVWERIFKYLFPSQLSRISMVSRSLYDIVSKLPVWGEMYDKAHPQHKNHLVGGVKPRVGKNPPLDFMLHMLAESLRICELCFSVYTGTDVPNDRLVYLPLPVRMWRVLVASKDIVFLPYSMMDDPKDWSIRLCVACCRKIFERCPESIPKTSTRPGYDLSNMHHLALSGFAPNGQPYFNDSEEVVLLKARVKYGGDVGVTAAGPSSSKAIRSIESRLEEVSMRFVKTIVDV